MTDTMPPVGGLPDERPSAETEPSVDPSAPPRYRVISGPDDVELSRRVSEAMAEGYQLYGSPAIATRHGELMVAQAMVLPS